MEHFKHEPGFEPVPLHIPVPPLGEPIPERKKPEDDGQPKPEIDIDVPDREVPIEKDPNSDAPRGTIMIDRKGIKITDSRDPDDSDDRDDDTMKQW